MVSSRGDRFRVMDSRLFEDDMDSIPADEPPGADSDDSKMLDDDEDVKYWTEKTDEKPGVIEEFKQDLGRFRDGLMMPAGRRIAWGARSFMELAYRRYVIFFFIIFVVATIYFGTLLHETLHIVAAAFVGEIPVGIRLNVALYSQVGGALSAVTGGFVQTAVMDPNNPGSALILSSGDPLHTAIIGAFPNVIMFMLGFTWLRKGLNETRPGFFAAGLVFTCSNLEIFIPSLHTDVTPTANYLAGLAGLSGNDVGAMTILVAAIVFGSGYLLSVIYDRWQRWLVVRHSGKYAIKRASKKPVTA